MHIGSCTRLSLSVVIPTKDRYDALLRALASISTQSVLPDEILIVDQTRSRGDWSGKILKSLPPSVCVDYLWNPSISGLPEARNLAIGRVKRDILLFLDDDVTLYPDFIERLLLSWSDHPEAAGISGVPDNYPRPSFFYQLWSTIFMRGPFHDDRQPVYWRAMTLTEPVRVTRFTGAMMSFRRSAINGVRFDDNLHGVADGEDIDLCVRLKGTFLIDPNCKLTHHFDPSGREKTHWTQRHARAHVYLYKRNWGRHKLAYAWLRTGYFVAALLGCASRKSSDPLRAMLAGCAEGKQVAM
jgi:GT2 family glycosyltransferase